MDVSWFNARCDDGAPVPSFPSRSTRDSTSSGHGRRRPDGRLRRLLRRSPALVVVAALSCLILTQLYTTDGSGSSTFDSHARLDTGTRLDSGAAIVRRSAGVHQVQVGRMGRAGRAAVLVRAVHDARRPDTWSIVSEGAASSARRRLTAFAPNRAPPA